MKRCASGNQRTGQPRCAQLTEKATNFSTVTRRSQAAVFAVTPAHGSGDASTKVTPVVSPTLKASSLPTDRHSYGILRKSGATTNPPSGAAITRPAHPPRPTLTRASRRRRAMSSGESAAGVAAGFGASAESSFMTDLPDPARERDRKEGEAHPEDHR